MFNSGISLKSLVNELKNEVDIAIPISNASYVTWLNALEQLLYTECIQEQKEIVLGEPSENEIDIASLELSEDESPVRFEDIYTIFADGTQLIKTTLTSGAIFPNTFCKKENNICYNTVKQPQELKIIYFVKPALKEVDESDIIRDGNVMVPIEFVDLVKAKLRGEAYKVANEDALAAKWLNDYNILLETFKVWIAGKASEFGM